MVDMTGWSEEAKAMYRIQNGTATDTDIANVENYGDRSMRQSLERKFDEANKKMKELHDDYGKAFADGVDLKGQPYKNVGSLDPITAGLYNDRTQ